VATVGVHKEQPSHSAGETPTQRAQCHSCVAVAGASPSFRPAAAGCYQSVGRSPARTALVHAVHSTPLHSAIRRGGGDIGRMRCETGASAQVGRLSAERSGVRLRHRGRADGAVPPSAAQRVAEWCPMRLRVCECGRGGRLGSVAEPAAADKGPKLQRSTGPDGLPTKRSKQRIQNKKRNMEWTLMEYMVRRRIGPFGQRRVKIQHVV
jgi:hypothetical protein